MTTATLSLSRSGSIFNFSCDDISSDPYSAYVIQARSAQCPLLTTYAIWD